MGRIKVVKAVGSSLIVGALGFGIAIALRPTTHVVTTKLVAQPAVTVTNTVTTPPLTKTVVKKVVRTRTVTTPTHTVTVAAAPPAPAGGVNPNDPAVDLGLASAISAAVQKGTSNPSIQIESQGSCDANVNGSLKCITSDQNEDFGQYSVTIHGYSFSGTLDPSNSVGDFSFFPDTISGTFQPSS